MLVRTLGHHHGDSALRVRAWNAAAAVVDPEIPVLSIADLGVLRDVKVENGVVEAVITPTYSGCPAMNVIALEGGYQELARIVHPHPTISEAVLDAARAVDGWATHA